MKKTRKGLQALTGSRQTSFLPEPDFKPKLPSKNTLTHLALSLMVQGKRISHRDFDNQTDSWRLAAYIFELRKMGWLIEDEEILNIATTKPQNRHIKIYFLNPDVIRKIKKMGVQI